jgi:protein-tyrosine phosphatase
MKSKLPRLTPWIAAAALAGLALPQASLARIDAAEAQRSVPDTLQITWSGANPVDIYQADGRDFRIDGAHLLVKGITGGHYNIASIDGARRYLILRDTTDGYLRDLAERVVPLAQGSNLRDIGGYTTADGKHVRWGLIYRSGGQSMLTAQDNDRIKGLGIAQLVDLRSSEERVIAPTRILGVPYSAIGYSMIEMMAKVSPGQLRNGADIYHNFPHFLAPQLKIVFSDLLDRKTPLLYNCAAGQDRTGFVTAMIHSALGVPREVIVSDYLLSTRYRHPEWEMPLLDAAAHPNDPVVQLFAKYQQRPNWKTPDPLIDAQGQPFLAGAFDEINTRWGSVEAYLDQEVGVHHAELERLRALYLE